MEEFFSRLREERESKGLDLADISEKTKINEQFLKALEEGNLKGLPKGYDRIFMKSYLIAIGTDVEQTLEEFDRYLGRREPTQIIDLDEFEREKQKTALNINEKFKYLFMWVPVVIILSVLIYLFLRFGLDDQDTSNGAKISEIKVEDYIDDLDTTQSAVFVPPKEIESDSLFISMTGLRKTWVRMVVDRRDTSEYTLYKGVKKEIAVDSLVSFVIGVGDGFILQLKDSTYRNMAKREEVISRLTIDKKGIRTLYTKIPKRIETVTKVDTVTNEE